MKSLKEHWKKAVQAEMEEQMRKLRCPSPSLMADIRIPADCHELIPHSDQK